MKRRAFISLLGATAAWPLPARAQQGDRPRRLGVLMPIAANDADTQARFAAFEEALRQLGWSGAHKLRVDYRWAAGDLERLHTGAAELAALAPDVILAQGTAALSALQQVSPSLPVVCLFVSDPVGSGLVKSLAHPGGSVTGFTLFEPSMGGKWLELFHQVAPGLRRVLVLGGLNPPGAGESLLLRAIETAAAGALALKVSAARVREAAEIAPAIDDFARQPNGGLVLLPDPIMQLNRDLIVARVTQHRLPAIFAFRYYVAAGGLMSYGIDLLDLYRRSAGYVDRILRGAMPADLPVQAPTKFELVINLKTAHSLGLVVPTALQVGATEVIE